MPLEEIKIKVSADASDIDKVFDDIGKKARRIRPVKLPVTDLDKTREEIRELQEQLEFKKAPEKIKELKAEIENFGKASKETSSSIGDIFRTILGAAAVSKITGFFSAAIGQYNTLNAALMRVESTSKAAGQNIERNKKLVQDLADKGFLSLTESANAFSDSISMGLNPDKAKKFVESLSDIAAVERTMGTLNEAVSSGISGLRSGSSERVENIGVSVKKLSQEYQINSQKVGQAAAMEKFYQGVIKESTKYQGEAIKTVDTLAGAQTKYTAAVQKAEAAIGKGLEPVMKSLYQTGTSIYTAFEKWFSGLDSTTKGLLLMVPLVAALVAALGTVVPVLRLISLSNPFGWVAIAIVAVGALMAALNELVANESGEKIVKRNKENAAALKELGDKAKELQAINKRTASQETELIGIKDKLKNKAKELGVNYDELAKKAKNAADMTQMLTNIERERDAKVLRDRIDKRGKAIASVEGSSEALSLLGSLRVGGITKGQASMALDKAQKEDIDAFVKLYQGDGSAVSASASASPAGQASETRFIETQKKLAEIEKNRLFTIAKIDREKGLTDSERKTRIQNAYEDAKQLAENEIGQLRSVYAEFIEDKYMADKLALDKSTNDAIRAVREQESAGEIIKEQAEARIQKIREANAKKQAQLVADSFAATANAAAGIAKGIGQIRGGDISGGVASSFSGAAGLSEGLKKFGFIEANGGASKLLGGLGMAGGMFSAATGLMSGLTSLFGKSDEERAREAAGIQRRQEEQQKILELQASYQKSMLAIQESQAKLPFEDLQRKLRLIDIEAQQSALSGVDQSIVSEKRLTDRQAAMQSVLSSQSGTISQNRLFSGTGSSPDELINFLSERAAQSGYVGAAGSIVDNLRGAVGMSGTGALNLGRALRGQLSGLQGNIPTELFSEIASKLDLFTSTIEGFGQRGYSLDAITISQLDSMYTSGADGLISEIRADTGIAENLLSVIEQSLANEQEIKANTKKTAENTTKLADGKGDAIVDIAAGGLSQNGAFIQGGLLKFLMGKTQIDTASMMLNPSVQNAILSTQVMDSVDERMAKGMDRLVQLNEQEVELLAIIAENLSEKNTELAQDLKQKVLDILAEFRSRS